MSEPFIGEIKMVGFTFAPRGWAFCNGQTLSIAQNQALFAILGTTYGGDGITNFKLPNLQGMAPVHVGAGITLGETAGETQHTLLAGELPSHSHALNATTTLANDQDPTGDVLAAAPIYSTASPNAVLSETMIGAAGGTQPHSNMQPSLTLNFVIALTGIFPSRN